MDRLPQGRRSAGVLVGFSTAAGFGIPHSETLRVVVTVYRGGEGNVVQAIPAAPVRIARAKNFPVRTSWLAGAEAEDVAKVATKSIDSQPALEGYLF